MIFTKQFPLFGFAVSLLFINARYATAFEFNVNLPSSRAMSMAGAFVAQADDSSAIWYNPAGMQLHSLITNDVTLESGRNLTPKLESDINEGVSYDTSSALKYIASYTKKIPFVEKNTLNLGAGVAVIRLYSLAINVNERSSAIDSTQTFGIVDADYYQSSIAVNKKLGSTISVGATLDFIWTNVRCHTFDRCVKNGPTGFGYTLGYMHNIFSDLDNVLRLGLVWRSNVDLSYSSIPEHEYNLTVALEDYLPGRPQQLELGASWQYSTTFALINSNVAFGKSEWSKQVVDNQPETDYSYFAMGNEWVFSVAKNRSLAFRLGYRYSDPENPKLGSSITSYTLGGGTNLTEKIYFDVAIEQRALDKEKLDMLTMSVSYQN